MRPPISTGFPLLVLACSGAPSAPIVPGTPDVQLAASLRGIPDHGDDPAVVFVEVPGAGACTGALVAADVVATARRCVEIVPDVPVCPSRTTPRGVPRDLTTLRVKVGETLSDAVERARGQSLVVPDQDDLCRGDLALLHLDAPIDDVEPLAVSPTGAAVGDHLRTVSLSMGRKVVRDHVPVEASSATELALVEAPCVGAPGGIVMDEATAQLVGVVSRSDPRCDAQGGWDVAIRPDAFFSLVERALEQGHVSRASHKARERKGAIDLGAGCSHADQCAAGACVTYAGGQYCTRECSSLDRCPAKTRCAATLQSTRVCIEE